MFEIERVGGRKDRKATTTDDLYVTLFARILMEPIDAAQQNPEQTLQLQPEEGNSVLTHNLAPLLVAPARNTSDGLEVLINRLPARSVALERREEGVVGTYRERMIQFLREKRTRREQERTEHDPVNTGEDPLRSSKVLALVDAVNVSEFCSKKESQRREEKRGRRK
jgi:hypothetical protein